MGTRTRATDVMCRVTSDFELLSFEATEFTAEEAAEKLSLPLNMLFKTLLAKGEKKGYVLAVVPSDHRLSLKKLADALGDKRVEMAPIEELTRLTGYLKGGVSPLGTRRAMPVVLDFSAFQHARISLSAGQRGLQMLVAPSHLQQAAKALVADISDDDS